MSKESGSLTIDSAGSKTRCREENSGNDESELIASKNDVEDILMESSDENANNKGPCIPNSDACNKPNSNQ